MKYPILEKILAYAKSDLKITTGDGGNKYFLSVSNNFEILINGEFHPAEKAIEGFKIQCKDINIFDTFAEAKEKAYELFNECHRVTIADRTSGVVFELIKKFDPASMSYDESGCERPSWIGYEHVLKCAVPEEEVELEDVFEESIEEMDGDDLALTLEELWDSEQEVEFIGEDKFKIDGETVNKEYVLKNIQKELANSKSEVSAAKYKGKTVQLNKPMRGDVKKYKVYVKNDKGNVVKVNFGDKNMEIKRDDPARRKSFRARHKCDNPGPKWKARYWSCKFWSSTPVTKLLKK